MTPLGLLALNKECGCFYAYSTGALDWQGGGDFKERLAGYAGARTDTRNGTTLSSQQMNMARLGVNTPSKTNRWLFDGWKYLTPGIAKMKPVREEASSGRGARIFSNLSR